MAFLCVTFFSPKESNDSVNNFFEGEILMNEGTIVQVIGPVVDIEFDAGKLPAIYNACLVKQEADARRGTPAFNLTLEVAHAPGRVQRALRRDVYHGRPRPRHEGARIPASRSPCRSAARPSAGS